MAVSWPLCLALDVGWLWLALTIVRDQMKPPGHYWVIVERVVSVCTLPRMYVWNLSTDPRHTGFVCRRGNLLCRKTHPQIHRHQVPPESPRRTLSSSSCRSSAPDRPITLDYVFAIPFPCLLHSFHLCALRIVYLRTSSDFAPSTSSPSRPPTPGKTQRRNAGTNVLMAPTRAPPQSTCSVAASR